MEIFRQTNEIRQFLADIDNREKIVLVPTMGNLHPGHLELINLASKVSNNIVVSIFVNPLQFLPNEDFASYPRTFADDCKKLSQTNCRAIFAPEVSEIYGNQYQSEQNQQFKVLPPPALADIFEGEFRPGFFVGVATVVLKLFNIINPQHAVFGKKDYQQLMVIENMVNSLKLPINIIAAPIIREEDGLALSSRNIYLSANERKKAIELSQELKSTRDEIINSAIDCSDYTKIEKKAREKLNNNGWQCDYFAIRRQQDLQIPQQEDKKLIILTAAKLGKTRLIDNIELDK